MLEGSGVALLPEQAEHLRAMTGLCGELLDITRDYLDYARLARGADPPKFEAVALSMLAAEVDRRVRDVAEGRGVSWRCEVEGADAKVTTDPAICLGVAGHLVSNALKSTPGGGSVAATFRRKGAWWTLTVADNGPGIPEEERPRVFEPLYRLPRDEKAGAEGCGMGLATCRERVAQLGGTVAIAPGPDGGTTLIVRLPVAGKAPIRGPSDPGLGGAGPYEDGGRRSGPGSTQRRTSVPSPGWLRMARVPRWRLQMPLAMLNPTPKWPGLVV